MPAYTHSRILLTGLRENLSFNLVPQRPTKNFPDVCLGKIFPEIHALRDFVARELGAAMVDQLLLCEVGVLADYEEGDDFT